MKGYRSSLLLLLIFPRVDLGAATDEWRTHIDFVNDQSFGFGTGNEHGAEMKVEIYDQCRMDSAQRQHLGEFYPSSSVHGIDADHSSVINNPGEGNSISFSFVEGISDNTNIYTDNGDNTAKVEFCAQVGLYMGGDLINFAEVKLTYWVDLVTHFTSLEGYTVTQAEEFEDQGTQELSFDGTLLAYFCNPYDYQELQNDGSIKRQGSVMHLCFKAPDGQFEVSDIRDLTVKNALADWPSQTIISGGVVASPGYAEKNCFDWDGHDTNLCLVSFVLTADFYDYWAITLTGSGSVLLELGDASGSRTRHLVLGDHKPAERELQQHESASAKFTVKAMQIKTEQIAALQEVGSRYKGPLGMVALAILLFLFVTAAAKVVSIHSRASKMDQASRSRRHRQRRRRPNDQIRSLSDCCGSSSMNNDTSLLDATRARRKQDSSCMTNDTSNLDPTRARKMPPTRFSSLNTEDLDAQHRLSGGSAVDTDDDENHGFDTIDMDDNKEDEESALTAIC